MISDVEGPAGAEGADSAEGVEEAEAPAERRDDTGLVVGSPAWLELQRSRERSRTAAGITREGMWRIAAGAVVLVISLTMTLTIVTSSGAARIELEPAGYVAFCVAPLLLGVLLVVTGLRKRSRSTWEPVAASPETAPGDAPPSEPA